MNDYNERKGDRTQLDGKRSAGQRAARATPQGKSHLEAIEQLLHMPVDVLKDGQPTRMPALGAIMHQLMQKSLAGNRKAERARQRFEALAHQSAPAEFEVLFVDNDYTRAFAASQADTNV